MNHEGDDLEVVRRLRALAERPVEPGTAGRVLARARRAPASRWGTTRLKVAAAMAGGFLVGSMGLASAGTLPNPVQDVAHSALGAVGISVPPGHDRYNGPECGGTYANHGEYVRAHPDDPAAGRSPCGKPNRAAKRGGGGGQPAAEASDRRGPPPWAQGNGQGKAKTKDKAKAPGGDEAEAEDDREAAPAPTTTAAPPTTAGPATTTTAPPTTTPSTMAGPTTTSTSTASTPTSTSTSEPPTTTTVP